jgi:uncharacterized protein (UPF0212 family)
MDCFYALGNRHCPACGHPIDDIPFDAAMGSCGECGAPFRVILEVVDDAVSFELTPQ